MRRGRAGGNTAWGLGQSRDRTTRGEFWISVDTPWLAIGLHSSLKNTAPFFKLTFNSRLIRMHTTF